MKSGYIFLIARLIKAQSKRTAKEEIFKREMQDPDFKELIRLVYSPSINFYMSDAHISEIVYGGFGEREFDREILHLLQLLSTRSLSGKAADEAVIKFAKGLTSDSYELLLNIFKRTLDLGLNFAMIDKVAPGLIKKQPYMRCSTEKESDLQSLDWSSGVFVQTKLDGMYVACRIHIDGSRTFTTRAGSKFPSGILDSLLPDTLSDKFPRNVDLNGEITLKDSTGKTIPRQTSNGVFNSALCGSPIPDEYTLHYTIWDVVSSFDVDCGESLVPYSVRLKEVILWTNLSPRLTQVETTIATSLEAALRIRDEMLAIGEEGVIIKDPYSGWVNGKHRRIIKLKGHYTATLRVVGFTEGKRGKFYGMVGSLQCISEDGLLLVNVSGFSDVVRNDMTLNRDAWFHKLVDVQHGGVIEDLDTGVFSLIEPRLAMDSIRTDIIVGDTLDKISKGS